DVKVQVSFAGPPNGSFPTILVPFSEVRIARLWGIPGSWLSSVSVIVELAFSTIWLTSKAVPFAMTVRLVTGVPVEGGGGGEPAPGDAVLTIGGGELPGAPPTSTVPFIAAGCTSHGK